MYCRKCGAEIPDDSVFCIKCGAPVEAPAAPSSDDAPATSAAQASETAPSRARKKSPWKWILVSFAVVALIVCGVLFFSSRGKPTNADLPANIDASDSVLKDKEKLQSISSSVLLIECYDVEGSLYTTGSGFIAFDSNTIVTNYHVIEDRPYSISARSESGIVYSVDEIIGFHADMDIAFLHIQGGTDLSPVIFSETPAEKTDPVIAIGSPLGLMNTVSEGIVSGFVQIGEENVIQFTASISHGSSGGVLLNEKGEAIGVTFGSFSNGQNLNLAVPIEYVNMFYSRLSPADQMSTLDFFLAGDQPLPAEYVLVHSDYFMESTVTVQGFVSSCFFHCYEEYPVFFLAENENAVLLYDDTSWYEQRTTLGWPQELQTESANADRFRSIVILVNNSIPLQQLTPGEYVVIKGTLYTKNNLYPGAEYASLSSISGRSLVLIADIIVIP